MKKNTLMKTSAIVASAVMAAAANGATVSAKTAAPRTMRRTKKMMLFLWKLSNFLTHRQSQAKQFQYR